jgi:hypothetical protein
MRGQPGSAEEVWASDRGDIHTTVAASMAPRIKVFSFMIELF